MHFNNDINGHAIRKCNTRFPIMKFTPANITKFQTQILTWYEKHQRDCRVEENEDPYHILVSEIALQQTQVRRVIPKSLHGLEISRSMPLRKRTQYLRLWSGLGYNKRALIWQKSREFHLHRKSSKACGQ